MNAKMRAAMVLVVENRFPLSLYTLYSSSG